MRRAVADAEQGPGADAVLKTRSGSEKVPVRREGLGPSPENSPDPAPRRKCRRKSSGPASLDPIKTRANVGDEPSHHSESTVIDAERAASALRCLILKPMAIGWSQH